MQGSSCMSQLVKAAAILWLILDGTGCFGAKLIVSGIRSATRST